MCLIIPRDILVTRGDFSPTLMRGLAASIIDVWLLVIFFDIYVVNISEEDIYAYVVNYSIDETCTILPVCLKQGEKYMNIF